MLIPKRRVLAILVARVGTLLLRRAVKLDHVFGVLQIRKTFLWKHVKTYV